MKRTAAFLAEKGIRPSYQRLRIFNALAGTKEHPSAETIYRELLPEIPSLSRTTVYSTLALFTRHGLAVQIPIDGEEMRYDADTSEHGHFRCSRCGRVFDFPMPKGGLVPELPAGFMADIVQLFCVGSCAACATALAGAGAGDTGSADGPARTGGEEA
jgi:Fe2+ or Zn2+ uptake regulation protein